MPSDPETANARHTVVPSVAGRSLWLAAIWTGVGAAFVGAVLAIVVVAICWLPASGTAGNAASAIHAGLLTFLAGLHGGITVDGTSTSFAPLGLCLGIAALAWRAGSALGDTAEELGETDSRRLLSAGFAQLISFAVICGIAAAFATLGTSSISAARATFAAGLLWLVTGSVAFARASALGSELRRLPNWLSPAGRLGAAALAVYLAAGALVAAGSLALHFGAVTTLSRQLGGGWSGVPVLVLGIVAAPNAAVAGVGYLAGPGFAVGQDTVVRLWTTAHGTVPAFPLLGALPRSSAGWLLWLFAVATALTAGCCVALLARRGNAPWRDIGGAAGAAAVFAALGAALAGGGIGGAGLSTIGVSPWQLGVAVGGGTGAVAAAVLGGVQLAGGLRTRVADDGPPPVLRRLAALPGLAAPEPAQAPASPTAEDPVEPGVAEDEPALAEDQPAASTSGAADAITAPIPRVRVDDPPGAGELAG